MTETLVTASLETRKWLETIKGRISKEIPYAKYHETKYWASFESPVTNRRFVQLNPRPKNIRLFTKLPLSFDARLELTPSSRTWAETYPSILKIRSEGDVEKAIHLIKASYNADSEKPLE